MKKRQKKVISTRELDSLSEQEQERIWFFLLAQTPDQTDKAYRLWKRAAEQRDQALDLLDGASAWIIRLQEEGKLTAAELKELKHWDVNRKRATDAIKRNSPKGTKATKNRATEFRKGVKDYIRPRWRGSPDLTPRDFAADIRLEPWASKNNKREKRSLTQIIRVIKPIMEELRSEVREKSISRKG